MTDDYQYNGFALKNPGTISYDNTYVPTPQSGYDYWIWTGPKYIANYTGEPIGRAPWGVSEYNVFSVGSSAADQGTPIVNYPDTEWVTAFVDPGPSIATPGAVSDSLRATDFTYGHNAGMQLYGSIYTTATVTQTVSNYVQLYRGDSMTYNVNFSIFTS